MEVRFTRGFVKELKKQLSQTEALNMLKKLINTSVYEGDLITVIGNMVLKEKKHGSFRFYFIFRNDNMVLMTEQELRQKIILFIQISKKNNQQIVINKLKDDLKNTGFKI